MHFSGGQEALFRPQKLGTTQQKDRYRDDNEPAACSMHEYRNNTAACNLTIGPIECRRDPNPIGIRKAERWPVGCLGNFDCHSLAAELPERLGWGWCNADSGRWCAPIKLEPSHMELDSFNNSLPTFLPRTRGYFLFINYLSLRTHSRGHVAASCFTGAACPQRLSCVQTRLDRKGHGVFHWARQLQPDLRCHRAGSELEGTASGMDCESGASLPLQASASQN
jgi:hypothetical protein